MMKLDNKKWNLYEENCPSSKSQMIIQTLLTVDITMSKRLSVIKENQIYYENNTKPSMIAPIIYPK